MNTLLQTSDKPGVTLHLLHIDVPHTLKTNKRNKRAAFTALREEVQDIALMKQSTTRRSRDHTLLSGTCTPMQSLCSKTVLV